MKTLPIIALSVSLALLLSAAAPVSAQSPSEALEKLVPREADEFNAARSTAVTAAAERLEAWAAGQYTQPIRRPQTVLNTIAGLVDTKARVDRQLESVLATRSQFVELPAGDDRRTAMRNFLQVTSQLIDLSGRLRYMLRDAIDNATYDLTPHPKSLDRLIDILIERKVSIGAAVMTYALFDPPPQSGVAPFPMETKRKVLRLIKVTRQADLLPRVARLLKNENTPDELLVLAAYVVREIGLPQDAVAGQDDKLPAPAITAAELHEIVARADAAKLSPVLAKSRSESLAWLSRRAQQGVEGETFRVAGFDLREGDWLMMRNPSPYNLFTDLSPGLFTHVGIVAAVTGDDGIRRFVIVDLPERGERIPAGNVDAYLDRTLHYFFLRHEDPKVQQRMGEVARSVIGNETQFDLTFRTDRVLKQKGQPLKGRRIHTYCAGFLLMCAQETPAPREEFFPILEAPAGGHCLANLKKLGLSIGEDFVSPTSAVFSPQLKLVARREPMYSPGREVKESVYNHFARQMINSQLSPAPDLFQSLREKVAGLSKFNPWLARALAKANNVSEHMDLESAAKASAVIETLDEIAAAASDGYHQARLALTAGPIDQLRAQGATNEDIKLVETIRSRHADVFQQLVAGRISPRQLRIELVDFYKSQGRQNLDRRFFHDSGK